MAAQETFSLSRDPHALWLLRNFVALSHWVCWYSVFTLRSPERDTCQGVALLDISGHGAWLDRPVLGILFDPGVRFVFIHDRRCCDWNRSPSHGLLIILIPECTISWISPIYFSGLGVFSGCSPCFAPEVPYLPNHQSDPLFPPEILHLLSATWLWSLDSASLDMHRLLLSVSKQNKPFCKRLNLFAGILSWYSLRQHVELTTILSPSLSLSLSHWIFRSAAQSLKIFEA